MIEIFFQGGILFMSLISIGLLGVIYSYWVYDDNIITYGNLSLAVGIFGTLIGLYDAFAAIENMGSVSQGILAGGLKVASTTTLYGLLVYIISRILHLIS